MTESIRKVFSGLGITHVGIAPADLYNSECGTDYSSAVVALFPYYCGYPDDSNISIYTHGKDYHLVARQILSQAAEMLGLCDYKVQSDTGPYIERRLAVQAGLCFVGRNGLCINEELGSYFFIGYIVCREEFCPDVPLDKSCLGCELCVRACPGNALEGGFCEDRCLSAITQKKGELNLFEKRLIVNNKTVFGCDICQKVCPHNRGLKKNALEQFSSDRITHLALSEISKMSNREFGRKYYDRAFSWRGKSVVQRNLDLLERNGDYQMKKYALLGEKLGHSYSPDIHKIYFELSHECGEYILEEIPREEFKTNAVIKFSEYDGLNVTIPYKQDIIECLDSVSDEAEKIGAVNTVAFAGGQAVGYNTDYMGIAATFRKFSVPIAGKKIAVLGTGGAARAVCTCCRDLGAGEIVFASTGKKSFMDCAAYDYSHDFNADVIINATPVGMFPNVGKSPLKSIGNCGFVFDLIYNPPKTELMNIAEKSGALAVNGLYMLVAQAVSAQAIWNGTAFSEECADEIYKRMKTRFEGDNQNEASCN